MRTNWALSANPFANPLEPLAVLVGNGRAYRLRLYIGCWVPAVHLVTRSADFHTFLQNMESRSGHNGWAIGNSSTEADLGLDN